MGAFTGPGPESVTAISVRHLSNHLASKGEVPDTVADFGRQAQER